MDPSSPAFRIGELARRTGVGVPTLRAWELRYRVLRPARTAGGQRLYSVDDEQRVRAVQELARSGVAIGAAARSVAAGASVGAPPARGRSAVTVATRRSPARPAAVPEDTELLVHVHDTTRAMVHASRPADVVEALGAFVRQLGGTLVDASVDDAVVPVDLSFGEGKPVLPRAEPMSLTRLRLEQSLPLLVEDARRIIELLRGQRRLDGRRP